MKLCRGCGAPLTTTVVDLGRMPLANALPRTADEASNQAIYPLHAFVCDRCFLVQLSHEIPPEEIFSEYTYFSSYSDTWLDHAQRFANNISQRLALDSSKLVIEIASNDGYLLRFFRQLGLPVLGIEPAANVARVAEDEGIPTLASFFSAALANRLKQEGKGADLLVGNNVLAHVPDLHDFIEGLRILLSPNGVVTLEFPHVASLIEGSQFDTIYHEHFSYISLLALEPLLWAHGLRAFQVEPLATHGGSLRLYVCHVDGSYVEDPSMGKLRRFEASVGLNRMATYTSFGERAAACRDRVREFFDDCRRAASSVVAYGAAAKGMTFLNYCQVSAEDVLYVVDRNPVKQGRFTPGSGLRISDPSEITKTKPDLIFVLPWNLLSEITTQLAFVRSWGASFVVAIPELRVLQ